MSKLTDQIREYVRCPQFDGGTEYGEWGSLSLNKRRLIKELCEQCERQEEWADTFFKETQLLKQQLAEKDEEIKYYHQVMIEQKEKIDHLYEVIKKNSKTIRHQVCEEIREKFLKLEPWCFEEPQYFDFNAKEIIDILDQIEQGESDGTRNSKNV